MRFLLVVLALSAAADPVMAADKADCADSNLIKRFADANLIDCSSVLTQDSTLVVKPFNARSAVDDLVKVAGVVETRVYVNPPDRSALEVNRHYEAALLASGGQILFSCAREACGTDGQTDALVTDRIAGLAGDYVAKMQLEPDDLRYVAVRIKSAKGDAYVWVLSVYSSKDRRAYSVVKTVVTSNAQAGPSLVSAAAMVTGLGVNGHVPLYGLQFELDKAVLKSESQPQLDEVAKLLTDDPELRVFIACHNDGLSANTSGVELSRKRAQAIADALVKQGIKADRLFAQGLGAAAPLTTNHDEAGRARNRRVELVERLD
jgi:outer membrane protein OmpA-like peptidoglycan-associated protein